MNKTMRILIKLSLQALLVAGTSLVTYGQKLNNVQEGSVQAPAGVKVDGKLGEWNNTFQAYNKATHLTYTLSNDDKNLYLVVKSTDGDNTNKVLAGGISLAINTDNKKKEKGAFIITFPVIDRAALRNMRAGGAGGAGGGAGGGGGRGGGGAGGGGGRGGRGGGGGAAPRVVDTAALIASRKEALAAVKEIKAIGFKDIPDSIVSIYNTFGIKAAATVDEKGAFVYELSVPLDLITLSTTAPKEFAYDIKVNGMQQQQGNRPPGGGGGPQGGGGGGRGGGGGGGRGGGGGGGGFGGGGFGGGGGNPAMNDMISPTDFWGKYTLIKK